jgi:translin
LKDILKQAVTELEKKERKREEIIGKARKARMLSKQSIMLIHNRSFKEAETKMREAKILLIKAEKYAREQDDLRNFSEIIAAWEEYAEACIFHEIKVTGVFPELDIVGGSLDAYVLGLGDVVGELRREALDFLRVGDFDAAEAELKLMEQIYLCLVSMEEASVLLKGLRRKLDVARSLIERTRGELTSEAGRRRLGKSVKQLVDMLEER